MTNLRGVNSRNEARARGFYLNGFAYQRQETAGRIANAWVAALRRDITSQTLERLARVQHLLQARTRSLDRLFDVCQHQHVRAKLERQIEHGSRRFVRLTSQNLDALFNFERVSDGAAKRLVHVSQQRTRFDAAGVTGAHERVGQLLCSRFLSHERAVPDFHVDDHGIETGSAFL